MRHSKSQVGKTKWQCHSKTRISKKKKPTQHKIQHRKPKTLQYEPSTKTEGTQEG